jgi:hypothetical protein
LTSSFNLPNQQKKFLSGGGEDFPLDDISIYPMANYTFEPKDKRAM